MEAMRDRQAIRTERRRLRAERRKIKMDDDEAPSEEAPSEEASSEEAPSEETSSEEAPEEASVDSETGASDEESGFTGDYGFDGQRQPTEQDLYYDNFFSANGGENIKPNVKEVSRRIEKLKTKINDLMVQLAKYRSRAGDTIDKRESGAIRYLEGQIRMYQTRLAKNEEMLAGFAKADGDYSDANGEGFKRWVQRRAMVRQAKRFARMERRQAYRARRRKRIAELLSQFKAQGMPQKVAMMKARQQAFTELPPVTGKQLVGMGRDGMSTTIVDSALKPSISANQITVPPTTSSADGTGLIGWDDMSAFDAPEVRNVELDFSNADGKKKKTWMWVGIGVGVAVLGIIAYRMMRKK